MSEFGLRPDELSLFRYRGNGCPGPTRVETQDGRSFELTYQDMWEDEATSGSAALVCPNAIGKGTPSLAASDVWPGGGGPAGEDEVQRYHREDAARQRSFIARRSGRRHRRRDRPVGFRDFDGFQPHQVRKKRAVWAQVARMKAAGRAVPQTYNLRVEECARPEYGRGESGGSSRRAAPCGREKIGRTTRDRALRLPRREVSRAERACAFRARWRAIADVAAGTAPGSSGWRGPVHRLGSARRRRCRRGPRHRVRARRW